MKDIRLMIDDVKFSSRSVGVIIKNNKVLFQKRVGDEFFALPGGAIGVTEKGSDVILREIEEETGEKNAKVIRPLWFVEYMFTFNKVRNHQYILGYLVDIPNNSKLLKKDSFMGIEEGKNVYYEWIDLDKLLNTPIKPDYLYDKLLNIKDEYEYICEEQRD